MRWKSGTCADACKPKLIRDAQVFDENPLAEGPMVLQWFLFRDDSWACRWTG